MNKYKVCMISGLSGTGKTTIGKAFVENKTKSEVFDWIFVDQDSYYKQPKPEIILSSGIKAKNWDCLDAIDWDRLNIDINNYLNRKNVMLVGFALITEKLNFPIHKHIHLVYGTNDDIKICCENRRKSKNLTCVEQMIKDEMMVKEIVFPFYALTLKNSKITDYIPVYTDNNRRVNLQILIGIIDTICG